MQVRSNRTHSGILRAWGFILTERHPAMGAFYIPIFPAPETGGFSFVMIYYIIKKNRREKS
jgi:hypothetical protein